jgi:hypothetical protein
MCIDALPYYAQGSANRWPGYFFLCLFFLRRFLRLCVAILCFFLFFPLGISNALNFGSGMLSELLQLRMGVVKQLFQIL